MYVASLFITSEIKTDIHPQKCDAPHDEFLDDYRLAIKEESPPVDGIPSRLLVLDVEGVTSSAPVQAWFHGPASSLRWVSAVEVGGCKPSPQEVLHAPFYPDPSQRILALSLHPREGFLVMGISKTVHETFGTLSALSALKYFKVPQSASKCSKALLGLLMGVKTLLRFSRERAGGEIQGKS